MQTLFATCPKGLEYLLRDELRALGAADAHEALAGVHFSGSLELAYRACLWSRLASRILLRLVEFDAIDGNELYAGVRTIDWTGHLTLNDTFSVDAVSGASTLRHTQYIALRTKDAIADQFRDSAGTRPNVDVDQPSIRVNVRIHRDRATVSLDLSGTPLHRRGWRVGQGEAPLKENLACAMLLRANWPSTYAANGPLLDPMCGAGTLLIEGALMAADVAPGLRRDYFGFLGWRGHDPHIWETMLAEAQERAATGLRGLRPVFFGYDHDPDVVAIAKRNAQAAGVAGFLRMERQAVEHLKQPDGFGLPGLIICNPPYGERLGDGHNIAALYRVFGERLRAEFSGWRAAVMIADADLGHALGLRAEKRYALYNGALECRFLTFDLATPEPRPRVERPLSEGARAVTNRLVKNRRHLRKRLAREGVSCYRIYDADLPEYAAAVDVYTPIGRDGESPASVGEFPEVWLHVQEYAPPNDIPAYIARERLGELVRAAIAVFEIPRGRVSLKTRLRGKGGTRYGRMDGRDEFLVVEEGVLKFRVNLFDHLDTGLFLDHRPLRARLRGQAQGKRFLNLFCYTATASVYAAAGGAHSTTSVDLSKTYLDWAARNFSLNGLGGARHSLVQADVLAWLRQDRGAYDLVFVDPPTFSNSKRAPDFDVQRDHSELLALCGERLAPGGMIVFSNNLRRFKPDIDALGGWRLRDITEITIPFDYARRPDIHHCYELQRV